MELHYNNLGAWEDEYDGDEWDYEIDSDQMEEAFVNIQTDWVGYELKRKLTPEEVKLVKQTLKVVARNNDNFVDEFCEDYEEEVADYFREEAEKDMQDYKLC